MSFVGVKKKIHDIVLTWTNGWPKVRHIGGAWCADMERDMNFWKPNSEEKNLIKKACVIESEPKTNYANVDPCPGVRCNVNFDGIQESLNIALVTKFNDGSYDDTDLEDRSCWDDFTDGVPLTNDGKAIVDFYIYDKRDSGYIGLLGNVVVYYSEGNISKILGVNGENYLNFLI